MQPSIKLVSNRYIVKNTISIMLCNYSTVQKKVDSLLRVSILDSFHDSRFLREQTIKNKLLRIKSRIESCETENKRWKQNDVLQIWIFIDLFLKKTQEAGPLVCKLLEIGTNCPWMQRTWKMWNLLKRNCIRIWSLSKKRQVILNIF